MAEDNSSENSGSKNVKSDETPRAERAAEESAEPASPPGPMDKVKNWGPVKALTTAFKVAAWGTSPVWWPAKTLAKASYKSFKNGNKAAGTVAGVALLAFAGAATYGGSYAYVAANEQRVGLLNWPATEGSWTGRVVRFSKKGTFPCISWEGRLQIGEASTNFNDFSVRVFQSDIIDQVRRASDSGARVTLDYRDSRLDQNSFDEEGGNAFLRCIQHTDHTPTNIRPVVVPAGSQPTPSN
jgi:hypothetical protein